MILCCKEFFTSPQCLGPVWWLLHNVAVGLKRTDHEADHSCPSDIKIKNVKLYLNSHLHLNCTYTILPVAIAFSVKSLITALELPGDITYVAPFLSSFIYLPVYYINSVVKNVGIIKLYNLYMLHIFTSNIKVSTSSLMSVSVNSPSFSDTSISKSRKFICFFLPVNTHTETVILQELWHLLIIINKWLSVTHMYNMKFL